MTFTKLAIQRRSTRAFLERKVEQEVIDRILGIALTAPSSKNSKTTRIAVSDDPRIAEIVSRMRDYGSTFVKDAPLLFFVMADEAESDLWRENCAISATMLQLAAEEQGLVTCWVHVNGRLQEHKNPGSMTAAQYLHREIPALQPYGILCVIAAGYPELRLKPHDAFIDPDKIVTL